MSYIVAQKPYWDKIISTTKAKVTNVQSGKGTTLQEAENYYSSQGLKLRCCVNSTPDINNAYFALESNVGRSIFISYSIEILVDVSSDQRVDRVRIQRLGVSF